MAADPTRRTGISPDGIPAVSVTVLWVQQNVNAKLGASLVEDGVWGRNTQSAVGQYVMGTLGANAQGRVGDLWYSVVGVDPSVGRVLLTVPLEQALALSEGEEHVGPIEPEVRRPSSLLWVVGAVVLLGAGWVFYKSAYGRLDGFEEDWTEFNLHLRSAQERVKNQDCNSAYAHWEQARISSESLGDKRSEAGRKLVDAARLIRKAC